MLARRLEALDASRYIATNAHKQSQSSQQSRDVELVRATARPGLRLMGTENAGYKKYFLTSEKKEQNQGTIL